MDAPLIYGNMNREWNGKWPGGIDKHERWLNVDCSIWFLHLALSIFASISMNERKRERVRERAHATCIRQTKNELLLLLICTS